MANKTIKVNLKRSIGVRAAGATRATYYGPGEVEIPLADAVALGITDADGNISAIYEEHQMLHKEQRTGSRNPTTTPGGPDTEDAVGTTKDTDGMTRDELEAEATRLGITIDDGKGENADGAYSVEQLKKKIKKKG